MEIKRKTNILIKTERRIIIHQPNPDEKILCEKCSEQMMSTQSVAIYQGISTREVYRLIEKGKYRFVETDSKVIYICSHCFDMNALQLETIKEK